MFDKLYNASKDAIKAAKKPLVADRVKRGIDSAASSLMEEKIDLEDAIDGLRMKIANGESKDFKKLAEKKLDLDDIDGLIKMIEAEKDYFFPKEEA